jgi:hypothetical protein
MKKGIKVLTILLISFFFVFACTKQKTDTGASGALKGVSLSPKSFEENDFLDFFEKAKQTGKIITWAGDWQELSNTEGGAPIVVASLASQYNYIPVIQVHYFNENTGKPRQPLTQEKKQEYKNSAIAFAQKFKPKYFGIGIEVNSVHQKSPEDFEEFVEFYNEVFDAVKEVSPQTKIFTTFQLERMKGLNGGLFGGVNDSSNAQWFLLDKFKSDLIVFTTYPCIIFKSPSEIPENYYSEINSFTSKPIAFSEIGWFSGENISGWESSESEQAEFIPRFFDLTKELNKEFAVWSFMYDQNLPESSSAFQPLNSMALRNSDGSAKKAWNEWIKN